MVSDAAEGSPSEEQTYPSWKPIDWASHQRTAAILGLLLLALAYVLIAGTSTNWGGWAAGTHSLDTFFPIGISLLCLGTTLLSYVLWYAYKHGHNSVGDRTGSTTLAYVMLTIEGLAALITLTLQLLGAALVATVGWPGWEGYSSFSYILPGGLCVLITAFLALSEYILPWRPTRDPMAPGSALCAPVTGVRLGLRWLVMLLARNVWLALGAPLYVFITIDMLAQPDMAQSQPVPISAVALGVIGAIYLVVALVELTHGAHVAAPAS